MEGSFDYLKRRCKEAGLTLTQVCRELNIPLDRVWYWKNNESLAIQTFRQIEKYVSDNSQKETPGQTTA